ncbi:MAG: signal peptidase I [Lachnospiraceae bacterium]|nr:signal peptidase I [Lachnospiraceae bacterium]
MSDPQTKMTQQDLLAKVEQMRRTLQEVRNYDQEQEIISRETLESAQAEASRILDEASQNADQIREKARIDGQADLRDEHARIEMERDDLQQEIDSLQAQKDDLMEQLSGISSRLKDVVSENMPEGQEIVPEPAVDSQPAFVPEPAARSYEGMDKEKADVLKELDRLTEQLKRNSESLQEPSAAAAAVPAAIAGAAAGAAAAQAVQAADTAAAGEVPAAKDGPPTGTDAGEVQAEAEPEGRKKRKGLKILIGVAAALALLFVLLTQVFFGIKKVGDGGMEGVVSKGKIVVYSRLAKDPMKGDVVMIKDNGGNDRVRYVAALVGDKIDYDLFDGRLYVNDKVALDSFTQSNDDATTYPHELTSSEVFVLCNNREEADNEGLIPKQQIKGKVILVL